MRICCCIYLSIHTFIDSGITKLTEFKSYNCLEGQGDYLSNIMSGKLRKKEYAVFYIYKSSCAYLSIVANTVYHLDIHCEK